MKDDRCDHNLIVMIFREIFPTHLVDENDGRLSAPGDGEEGPDHFFSLSEQFLGQRGRRDVEERVPAFRGDGFRQHCFTRA